MDVDLPPTKVPQLTLKRRRTSMEIREGVVNALKESMGSARSDDEGGAASADKGARGGTAMVNCDLLKLLTKSSDTTLIEQKRVAEAVFRRYDVDENGVLDEWECALLLIELGAMAKGVDDDQMKEVLGLMQITRGADSFR